MQVGIKQIENILVNLGSYKKTSGNYGDKSFVFNAINKHDYNTLRDISNYFYEISGIYQRLCNYMATLYRYDWFITPHAVDAKKDKKKLENDFYKVLDYLDNSDIKRTCGNVALDIIKEGVYYGITIDFGDRFAIQKLPAAYCRHRYYSGIDPVIELNLQFFDACFSNPQLKLQILKTFPKDIQQAYILYKKGKLKGDYPGDKSCWYALDPGSSIKLNLNGSDFPPLAGVIPSIIDLDQAQDLDRQKTMQQLLKIIVQKLPRDKNGDLIFDVEEAKDIHNAAVNMLRRAIGVDVLTTFADIEKIDTKDSNSNTTTDDLEKVERTVYNNAGISHNLFNADGNLAETNAILVDEANLRDLPIQFANVINKILKKFNRLNHYSFRLSMLETTQFNYRELSKMYQEQVQIGQGKMLPQIALGQPQSSILHTLIFENDILALAERMLPPMSSNTMSSRALQSWSNNPNKGKAGRPEKEDNQKSDKTIQNIQSKA